MNQSPRQSNQTSPLQRKIIDLQLLSKGLENYGSRVVDVSRLSGPQKLLFDSISTSRNKSEYDVIIEILLTQMSTIGTAWEVIWRLLVCLIAYFGLMITLIIATSAIAPYGIIQIQKLMKYIGLIESVDNPTRLFEDIDKNPKVLSFFEQMGILFLELPRVKDASAAAAILVQMLQLAIACNYLNVAFTGIILALCRFLLQFLQIPNGVTWFTLITAIIISAFLIFSLFILVEADVMNKTFLTVLFVFLTVLLLSSYGIRLFIQFFIDNIINDTTYSEKFILELKSVSDSNVAIGQLIQRIQDVGISSRRLFPLLYRGRYMENEIYVLNSTPTHRTTNNDLRSVDFQNVHPLLSWIGHMIVFSLRLSKSLLLLPLQTVQAKFGVPLRIQRINYEKLHREFPHNVSLFHSEH
jgi:hypothetical protein